LKTPGLLGSEEALTSEVQWLLCVPPGLTISNSTFCPHSVFMICMGLRTNIGYFPIQH